MRHRLAILVALFTLFSLAAPAAAHHDGTDEQPIARNEANWFHCAGSTKVQNVSNIEGQLPSWDTSEPAESVQQGAGCGFYDNLLSNDAGTYDAVWEGTFTGNLETLTFELHRLIPQPGATAPSLFNLQLQVNGNTLFESVGGQGDTLFFTPSESGASESTRFSFTNLPYMTEHGEGTVTRTIRLEIASYNETQSLWVFDTTEVPAGVEMNPETPEPVRFSVS